MTSTVNRRYYIRTALFMTGYILVNAAAISGAFDDMKAPATFVFALIVTAPIIGHIWAYLAWLRDCDEYLRALNAKRFVVATGVTLAIATGWGFLELYAKTPHVSPALIFPLFWLALAAVAPFIRTTH
jgi:putative oxidoreductase